MYDCYYNTLRMFRHYRTYSINTGAIIRKDYCLKSIVNIHKCL